MKSTSRTKKSVSKNKKKRMRLPALSFFGLKRIFAPLNILAFVFICIALLFIYRLYGLQVVQGSEYREKIDNQYTKEERGKSISRGDIFFTTKDGTQILAATLRPLYTVAIEPVRITNKENLYKEIQNIMPIDKVDFMKKASKEKDPYEEIGLKVEKAVVEKLKKIDEDGLVFILQKERYYPGGDLASQVLGFMSFSGDDFAGSYGLEKYYDTILRRESSVKQTNIFASLFSDTKEVENKTDIKKNIAKEGSLNLTIEPTVQTFLEKKLDGIADTWSSKYAAGVIMDPQTGKIIAMATSDNFDLNTDTKHYRNYLIEDRLELGSIIKPLTVATGLDSGAIDSDFSYNDTGRMILNRYPITNYDNKGRGPFTDIQTILTSSLNTGVATIALEIGPEKFREYFYKIGFSEETGIDLPNEVYGLTSNLESNKDVEIATASFGQGIAITPMEAVRALAAVVNGGYLVTPYVVDAIEYGDLIPSKNINNASKERVFSEEVTKQVREYLINTVDDAGIYTSYVNENYSVGVKTGTAQIAKPTGGYYSDRFLHSMVSFFPEQPDANGTQFIVLLYTVEPKGVRYSSTTLKDPMFDISSFLINYYNIIPDRLRRIDVDGLE